MIRPVCGGRPASRARKVPSSVRLPPPPLPLSKTDEEPTNSMKMPIGPLGMTDEERAEFTRTGSWPQRVLEVPERPLGFGPNGLNVPPPNVPDFPIAKESAAAIRDYWRLDGKHEGVREGLEEGLEKGRLEGMERGRLEGREEALPEKLAKVLREKLTEALQAAKDVEVANSPASNRGFGRPSSLEEETTEMLAIIEANPGRGERYCRNLFEGALRQREPHLQKGGSDGKRWRNQRSNRAWKEAQKKLSDDAE
jgi:hypothetical protein